MNEKRERMTAQQLKNSILQMAIQGKLVPQDPTEEPASILLERIRSEKQRLMEEGKIKKESVIYRVPQEEDGSADNLPYAFIERFSDGVERDITSELPFEIPDNWEWVRASSIIQLLNGEKTNGKKLPYLDAKYLRGKSDKKEVIEGIELSVGTKVILVDGENSGEVFNVDENGYLGSTFKILFIMESVFQEFILKFLDVNRNMLKKKKKGSAIPHLNKEIFFNLLLPLPPLDEQKRIVEKLKELDPSIVDYNNTEQKLKILTETFPNQLKKSILQYAVQGKLIPQNPADETASILLDQINHEKKSPIESNKIKANTCKSVIFRRDNSYYEMVNNVEKCIDDELPFEIPDSWEWVRLGELCKYIQRGKSPKYSLIRKYPVVAQKCIQWSGFSTERAQFIEPDSIASYAIERILQNNDLLWNSTGLGTLGRMAIYDSSLNPYELAVADSHVTVIRPLNNLVLSAYLFIYFANPTVQTGIEAKSDGTTKQKELATNTIKQYPVPLPPLAEQYRIVRQIKELFFSFEDL